MGFTSAATHRVYTCGTCKTVWTVPVAQMNAKYGPVVTRWERHTPSCPDKPREVAR